MNKLKMTDLPKEDLDLYESVLIETPNIRLQKLSNLVRKYPNFVQARLNLALTYFDNNDINMARQLYQNVLNDFPNEYGAIAGLSMIFAAKNNYDKAVELAQKALNHGYEWSRCYDIIAESQERKGQIAKAAKTYLKSYQLSPHDWESLKNYCRLSNRSYHSPLDEDVPMPFTDEDFADLLDYLKQAEHCDHTLKHATRWAQQNNIDLIDFYQFLNAHGGFCDCEVLMNVTTSLDYVLNDDDQEKSTGLGFHFALSKEQEHKLPTISTNEQLLDFIQDLTDDHNKEWFAYSDEAWNAIHRCLTDGYLGWDNGQYPLNTCIMGGQRFNQDENTIVNLIQAKNVRDLTQALNKIDKPYMRTKYDAIAEEDYEHHKSADDFEFVWDMFETMRDLINKASKAKRTLLFCVLQE